MLTYYSISFDDATDKNKLCKPNDLINKQAWHICLWRQTNIYILVLNEENI